MSHPEAPQRSGRAASHGRPRRRRRPLRWLLLGVGLLLVTFVAGAVWLGVDSLRARTELTAAGAEVPQLQAEVERGDRAAAATTMRSVQEHVAVARDRTHGVHWSVARRLPWVGDDVAAVQTVSEVLDGVASRALPALMDATSLVSPASLAPVDGRVNLAPLVAAGPEVVTASAELQAAVRRLDGVDRAGLLPAVAAPLTDLRAQVGKVDAATATAARAVRLLPPMLGQNGPRTYLVLVQNNAELRATGGVATLLLLRADHGAVTVVQTRSAGGNLANLPAPVLPLAPEELALFSDRLGRFMADVTFTPDFPRSGQLTRAIWRQQVGSDLDGVLSVDPGALANVLGATGPVKLAGGEQLTSANAVQLLMNTVYLTIADPPLQDEFFASTAGSVFHAVASGQGKPLATLDALVLSARQGRLMMWSAHPDEQALISGTMLSGELVGVEGSSPVIGVYLNDGSASKIGYYLQTTVTATRTACRVDGSQSLKVTVSLTNTAPADAARLPPYIAGYGTVLPPGQVRTNVLLYAPTGGRVEDVAVSNGSPGVLSQIHHGQSVVGRTVQLQPGERVTVTYDLTTGPGQPGRPVLRVTPVVKGGQTNVASGCG